MNIIRVVEVAAPTAPTVTVQTTAEKAAAVIQEQVLITELLLPITVVVAAQVAILIRLLADQDIKALSLYDIEIDKGKIWQRYRI
jgi:hypothetical protein